MYFRGMQNTVRIKLLEEMIQEQPNDPFPPYALALEHAAIPGQESEAVRLLQSLQESHPAYLPLYYQLGHLLAISGDSASARSVFEAGMVLAMEQKNLHTRSELESYLENLAD